MVNEEAKGNVGFPFLVREQKYKRKWGSVSLTKVQN